MPMTTMMLSRLLHPSSLSPLATDATLASSSLASSSLPPQMVSFPPTLGMRRRVCVHADKNESLPPQSLESPVKTALAGVLFEPFVEVQSHLVQVPPTTRDSFARQRYSPACEAAVNDQINVEYSVSYAYHSLFAYFDRDNVALPGFTKFFKESSEEERQHAEKLMKYQNKRGGRVVLHSLVKPTITEFDHPEKGDALYAMEIALAMEKLVNEKLLSLHKVAEENDDPQLQDFLESEFLATQVEDIKKISEYVSQLRRVGKGHGVYHFDLQLQ